MSEKKPLLLDQVSLKAHIYTRYKTNFKYENPIAAYALSFDRLEIVYGAHQTEIISPKDKEQFINHVKIKIHIEIK